MALSKAQFTQYIKQFDFRELFNHMGWNNDKTKQPITVDSFEYTLQAVAEKSGFKILVCSPNAEGLIPDNATRKKIETKVTKLFQEHLIIFTDREQKEQIWLLAVRKAGSPVKITETRYHINQDPELLFQRAKGVIIEIDEEETITIVDVTQKVADNFSQNIEKVTKKFYDGFKKQHTAFLAFIKGIDDKVNKEWYASLMLNRLMFCYFIQKKGFLDKNHNYLRDKLNACKEKKGKNKFYSFYRNFLLVLFHSGLNEPAQTEEVKIEIGRIPYLNGGLFDVHELETTYTGIDIDDKAFEAIFDFFDQYEWHLDTRITATGKDINPDVIGYIFEKYINDRAQMGAYYTKEDITEYISKNCILPYLFDEVQRNYPQPFAPDGELWQLLKHSSDTYIYDAVKKGITLDNIWGDLPPEIETGLNPQQDNLVELRKAWNVPAPAEAALPTEIWREVIERRNRYQEIKAKIEAGEITHINDFITYNLNIRQFTQNLLETTNDPKLAEHFYKALCEVTIIDPTCGSGAFLFAAMNILEPLYEACIGRMRAFIEDEDRANAEEQKKFSHKYKFFRTTLEHIQNEHHPNQAYFIYKSIILRNLYGVDIMKEAVEIAKLRLFLKMVATVEADYRKENMGLEPLPDIDFNIKPGNTLVGFATLHDAIQAINERDQPKQLGLIFENELSVVKAIKEQAEVVAMAYERWKDRQTTQSDYIDFKRAKEDLRNKIKTLNSTLNIYLAYTYGVDSQKTKKYEDWQASHQPFHWFAEFYEIINDKGGFNVVIGNPPYVEEKTISEYKVINNNINTGGNLHSMVAAVAIKLLHKSGITGLIVPTAISNTDRMSLIRNRLSSLGSVWVSNYAIRPGKLFSGAEQRLSIYIVTKNVKKDLNKLFTSKYYKWTSDERPTLFENLYLTSNNILYNNLWLRIPNSISETIFLKILNFKRKVGEFAIGTESIYYKNTGIGYYITTTTTPPQCFINGTKTSSSRETKLNFSNSELKCLFHAVLSSSTFFLFYHARSNCRDLNPADITTFPIPETIIEDKRLVDLSVMLQADLEKNSWFQTRTQKQTGEVKIQSFSISLSKPIIDKIDTVLAEHYGFTPEELDFIINYDIKYRMGKELDNDTE